MTRHAFYIASETAVDAAAGHICCVAASRHGSVVAGSSAGALHLYRVVHGAVQQGERGTWLDLTEQKRLSRKPVGVITFIGDDRLLVFISESGPVVCDAATLRPVAGPVSVAKNATLVVRDSRASCRNRFAAIVKRRVFFFEVRGADAGGTVSAPGSPRQGNQSPLPPQPPLNLAGPLVVQQLGDVDLPGTARSLVWHGDRLVAGTAKGYFSASLRSSGETVKICDLSGDGDQATPLVKHVPMSADTVLLVNDLAVFVDASGSPSGAPVSLKARPKLLIHSAPFLCAWVDEQTTLYIYSRASGGAVQALPVPSLANAAARAADAPGVSADNSDDGLCVLACGRKIVVVAPMPLEKQAQRLLKAGLLDEALAVAEEAASCSPGGEFSQVPWADTLLAEAGFASMGELEFEKAVGFWRRCRGLEPAEVFPYIPGVAGPFLSLVPRKPYWDMHPPARDLASLVRSVLLARWTASGGSPEALAGPGLDDAVAGYVAAAQRALATLLADRHAAGLVPPAQRAAADTVLLLLHAEAGNATAAEALARDPARACVGSVVAPRLLALGRYLAAAAVLERAGDLGAALKTLQDVAEGRLTESPSFTAPPASAAAPADGGRGGAAGTSGAGDDYGGVGGGASASRGGGGGRGSNPREAAVELAAGMLARCAHAETFLHYAEWLCESHPRALLEALTAKRAKDAPPLPAPREEVVALLRRKGGAILVPFLQHLVESEGSQDPTLHTEFALALIATAATTAAAAARDARDAHAPAGAGPAGSSGSGEAGSSSSSSSSNGRSRPPEGLLEAGEKLRRFLDMSDLYNVSVVSARVHAEERAGGGGVAAAAAWLPALVVLSGKVNDHQTALRILLERMGDEEAAERYCADRRTPSARSDAFLTMLRLLLSPSADGAGGGGASASAPRRLQAARLLLSASWAVDPVEAIQLLPDDMPLAEVVLPLGGVLKMAVHAHRQAQVQRGLHKTSLQRAAEEVVAERSRAVVISSERCCSSCHVRLARADGRDFRPFVRFPTGLVSCYKCLQQAQGALSGLQVLQDRFI